MDINLKHAEFHLESGNAVRLLDAVGSTVACRDGHVWITQEWDCRDILLGAGEMFTLDRSGSTIIQALDAARIELNEASSQAQAEAARGIRRWRESALVRNVLHLRAPSSAAAVVAC